jgi:CBS domain-containing membrane protein
MTAQGLLLEQGGMKMMTVGDIMTREVFALAPDTSLATAARLFARRHITGAPVIDRQARLLGVVTLTDLVDPARDRTDRIGQARFYRLNDHATSIVWDDEGAVTPDGVVADVMSPFVLSIRPDASVVDAARLMVADDVHRLLVVDGGQMVGIVSSMDVLRAFAKPMANRLARDLRHPDPEH